MTTPLYPLMRTSKNNINPNCIKPIVVALIIAAILVYLIYS